MVELSSPLPLEAEAEGEVQAHRCVEEVGEEQVHGWALVEVV